MFAMMPRSRTPVSAPGTRCRVRPARLMPPITAAAKTEKIMFSPCPDVTDASRPVSIGATPGHGGEGIPAVA